MRDRGVRTPEHRSSAGSRMPGAPEASVQLRVLGGAMASVPGDADLDVLVVGAGQARRRWATACAARASASISSMETPQAVRPLRVWGDGRELKTQTYSINIRQRSA